MGWNSTGLKSGTKSNEETEDEESMNFIGTGTGTKPDLQP